MDSLVRNKHTTTTTTMSKQYTKIVLAVPNCISPITSVQQSVCPTYRQGIPRRRSPERSQCYSYCMYQHVQNLVCMNYCPNSAESLLLAPTSMCLQEK